jgi:hypothetical protein
MGPANGGLGWDGVITAATTDEAIDHALREEKAFLRTLFAGKEYVAARGRDPAVLRNEQALTHFPLIILEPPPTARYVDENCLRLISSGGRCRKSTLQRRPLGPL